MSLSWITHLNKITELTFWKTKLVPSATPSECTCFVRNYISNHSVLPKYTVYQLTDGWVNISPQLSLLYGNYEIESKFILKFGFLQGLILAIRVHQGFSPRVAIFCLAPQSMTAQSVLWPKWSASLPYIHTIFNHWQLNRPTTFHCNCSTNLNGQVQHRWAVTF